jgi:hypothetical protein
MFGTPSNIINRLRTGRGTRLLCGAVLQHIELAEPVGEKSKTMFCTMRE